MMLKFLLTGATVLVAICGAASTASADGNCGTGGTRSFCYDGVHRKIVVPYDGVVRKIEVPYDGVHRKVEVPYDGVVRKLPDVPYDGVHRKVEVPYDGVHRQIHCP